MTVDHEVEPEEILYIAAGVKGSESMVYMMELYRQHSPFKNARHILATTSNDFRTFKGETVFYDPDAWRADGDSGSHAATYRNLVMAVVEDNLCDSADMMLVGGYYPAAVLRALLIKGGGVRAMKYRKLDDRPLVVMSPKVTEGSVSDTVSTGVGVAFQWWVLGTFPNTYIAIGQLKREYDLAVKQLSKYCPRANPDQKLIRQVAYVYDDTKIVPVDKKEDIVVWNGRLNSAKDPKLALEVMALLEARGIRCEMFVPSVPSERTILRLVKANVHTVNHGLPREVFWKEAGRAKVVLVTSKFESIGFGWLEIIERGAIPVMVAREWTEDFVTPDGEEWPLRFKTPGEAVEMCIDALENYEHYLALLRDCMKRRYSKPFDWEEHMRRIWNAYISNPGMKYAVYRSRCLWVSHEK